MVKAVMNEYGEDDTKGLFKSTNQSRKPILIFIFCIIIDILIFAGAFFLSKIFGIEFLKSISTILKWITGIIFFAGLYQITGYARSSMKKYSINYTKGYVFTLFDINKFDYFAVHEELLGTSPEALDSISEALGKETETHSLHSYDELSKAVEDKDRFYLFFKDKKQLPLIVRKEAISVGTAEELRHILSSNLEKSFKIRK